MTAIPVTVLLTVKAIDAEHAKRIVHDRLKLVEWFCDESMSLTIGFGYPIGSLLYYRVQATAVPTQAIPQIQG